MLIPFVVTLLSFAAPEPIPREEQAATQELEKQLLQSEYHVDNLLPPLHDRDDPRTFQRRGEGDLPIAVPAFEEHRRVWLDQPELRQPISAVRVQTEFIFDKAKADLIPTFGVVVLLNGDGTKIGELDETDIFSGWKELGDPSLKYANYRGLQTNEAAESLTQPAKLDYMAALDPDGADIHFPVLPESPVSLDAELRQILHLSPGPTKFRIHAVENEGESYWIATNQGLSNLGHWLTEYGTDGPLSTNITALAIDGRNTLWVGTPLGLSSRDAEGNWRHIRGKDGLPHEDVTALAVDANDRLWIGTSNGVIHYRPYEVGRQWFYRQGLRYLPADRVNDISVNPDGRTIYVATDAGLGILKVVETTLLEKAETIEKLVNERHRRFGLVAAATLDNATQPTSHTIHDDDNDGLWTAYHVAAMSLAYAVTGLEEAKRSAKESMDAVIMLQNASGTPGLVARSVVPAEIGKTKGPQWRPTPDETMYWKSDTSSDEIDGHYLAFYTYWEHIASKDEVERKRVQHQVRTLTDYLVDNNYLLIDWDGEHTRWGFWQPAMLNDDPSHYLEHGLNALQMLSFLKVAHHITGDAKYEEHYQKLIKEHGYLNNVLLEKKVFPDENNHSDNQLAYVAWYPILQLEQDPLIKLALKKAVRRHYRTLERDRSSFFYFVTATVDPDFVDLEGAIQNLREIPTDRRLWGQLNSHRADLVFDPYVDRFGKRQLMTVLPADERTFAKWNGNPYIPDNEGDGTREDDGAAYLLPYWMARYHGFLKEGS